MLFFAVWFGSVQLSFFHREYVAQFYIFIWFQTLICNPLVPTFLTFITLNTCTEMWNSKSWYFHFEAKINKTHVECLFLQWMRMKRISSSSPFSFHKTHTNTDFYEITIKISKPPPPWNMESDWSESKQKNISKQMHAIDVGTCLSLLKGRLSNIILAIIPINFIIVLLFSN